MKNNVSKFLINPLLNENLLCAISGGQDSIVLLILFYHLKTLCAFGLYYISCNHFWTKKNVYNEIFLLKLSFLFKIELNIFLGEIVISNEEKGRYWRRKNFSRTMSFYNVHKIALGHNSSDEVETAIWHLLRGTSSSGIVNFNKISGGPSLKIVFSSKQKDKFLYNPNTIKKFQGNMINFSAYKNRTKSFQAETSLTLNSYKNKKFLKEHKYIFINASYPLSKIQVIRPLNLLYRQEIQKILIENNLPIFIDESNQSLQITRNRIRLFLLPLFRIYFTPNSDFQIKKYLQLVRNEQSFFFKLNLKILEQYCTSPQQTESLSTLPPILKERILHFVLTKYLKAQIQKIHIENFKFVRRTYLQESYFPDNVVELTYDAVDTEFL